MGDEWKFIHPIFFAITLTAMFIIGVIWLEVKTIQRELRERSDSDRDRRHSLMRHWIEEQRRRIAYPDSDEGLSDEERNRRYAARPYSTYPFRSVSRTQSEAGPSVPLPARVRRNTLELYPIELADLPPRGQIPPVKKPTKDA